MNQKAQVEIIDFISMINNNISDIENGRFTLTATDIATRNRKLTFQMHDNITDVSEQKYCYWYVLRCRNGDKIYPPDVVSWINNFIVERSV